MIPFNLLRFYLLLILSSSIDLSSAHKPPPSASSASTSYLPRAFHRARNAAAFKTHQFARDLRIAFNSVLTRRDDPSRHVVYCKQAQKQSPFNSGTGGGDNSNNNSNHTSSSTRTSTTGRSSPTSVRPPQSSTGGSPAPTSSPPPASRWRLTQSYSGDNFLSGFDFFTGDDPTHGLVDYVDEATARSSGILELNSAGNIVMRVETTANVANNRRSVRIHGKDRINGGILTMDAIHMPTGCGTWPAFWTNGPNWPVDGEIDILEGVHDYTNNQATIHADRGCTLPTTDSQVLGTTGQGQVIFNTDCAAETTGNQGCGFRAASSNSFGKGFNDVGGGVYAMTWDSSGIAVYFFPRNSIPADLTADAPNPDGWGSAMARWPASTCDPSRFFIDHQAIFDTTLCGDWAGAVWNTAGIPGQEQSCAQRTGVATCEEFVRTRGGSFTDAYWEVLSMKIYQMNG